MNKLYPRQKHHRTLSEVIALIVMPVYMTCLCLHYIKSFFSIVHGFKVETNFKKYLVKSNAITFPTD